jgi:hypothetical protein
MRPLWRALLLSLLGSLSLWASASASEEQAESYLPGAAELNVQSLLGEARTALHDLQSLPAGVDRDVSYASAITALTALFERHGCVWARPQLERLYRQPDCPDLHIGWSSDARISLRLEPLELKNPAFADWRILLLTLQSDTALRTEAPAWGNLRFHLRSGATVEAQPLSQAHPLWEQLDNLSGSFHPPDVLLSGVAVSYKQIFLLRDLEGQFIESAALDWGPYESRVPYYY